MNLSPSNVSRGPLPAEILVEAWTIVAQLKHDEACRRGHLCTLGDNCPEARSTDYLFALVSREWEQIALYNPRLFSRIRAMIDPGYGSIQNMTALPINNGDEVNALVRLSGTQDVYLSIGCSYIDPPQITPSQLTLRGMTERIVSLCFDADNSRLVHALANVSLPKLSYVHLDSGRRDILFTSSMHNLESFLIWSESPVQKIVCGHHLATPLRAKIPWSSMVLLDLHGVHIGFQEDAIEVMLHLATQLTEFRVGVDAKSSHLGVPNTSFLVKGEYPGPLSHANLNILWIEHHVAFGDANATIPPYILFNGADFSALRELHYSCSLSPHHNQIAWLMLPHPTVKTLDLDARFLDHTTVGSILAAFRGLTTLRVTTVNSNWSARYNPRAMDSDMFAAVSRTLPHLQTLELVGEASFTTEDFVRFVAARAPSLQRVVVDEWCGPSIEQIGALKEALRPLEFLVGAVFNCASARQTGSRPRRGSPIPDWVENGTPWRTARDERPNNGERVPEFFCPSCRNNHYHWVIDRWALLEDEVSMKERKRSYDP